MRVGERTAAGDTFDVELLTDQLDPLDVARRDRRDAVAAVHHDAARRPRRATRRCSPRSREAPRRRRPGSTSPTNCSIVSPRPVSAWPRSSSSWGSTRSSRSARRTRSTIRCTPSATASPSRPGWRARRPRRVVAVGTTAVRALESAAARGEASGRTDLFIHRGFDWQVVDLLMTNFHLPRTTLLMMIDAFVGDRWRRLYDRGAGRRLPLPVVRRRDARSTGRRADVPWST